MGDGRLVEARRAHDACQWRTAFALLGAEAETAALGLDDIARLGDAALWVGDFDVSATAYEDAFVLSSKTGDVQRSAGFALDLTELHLARGRATVAVGWFTRAGELLSELDDCEAHARYEDFVGLATEMINGDLEGALEQYRSAAEHARRLGAPGVAAVATMHAVTIMTRIGSVPDALGEIDRVMTAAVAGELDARSTARVYCISIGLLQALGDLRRAREWGEEVSRCSSRPGLSDFPGDCRLHRAELATLFGRWDHAQDEIEQVMPALQGWDGGHVGEAWYALGELRRLRGDLAEARDAYERAEGSGRRPQPGLALLRAAEGDGPSAEAMISAALDGAKHDPLLQVQLLTAAVEVRVDAGDLDGATEAASRLRAFADRFGTVVIDASAYVAECRVADPVAAVAAGRRAVALWRDSGAPFEAGVAQTVLAAAYERLGDEPMARAELETALVAFRSLGAKRHADSVQASLQRLGRGATPHRICRTFMFTDIVNSTRLIAAMGDDAWAAVLRWHDRAIRDQLAAYGGEEVKQRGDGFFAAFADPAMGIACASAIQRSFTRQRAEAGFAPDVRIGIHQADALQLLGDYAGRGVHEAARIAETAGAGQIVASETTAHAASAAVRGPAQSAELRGLPEPIALVEIEWDVH